MNQLPQLTQRKSKQIPTFLTTLCKILTLTMKLSNLQLSRRMKLNRSQNPSLSQNLSQNPSLSQVFIFKVKGQFIYGNRAGPLSEKAR
jgi:hypothetical protein